LAPFLWTYWPDNGASIENQTVAFVDTDISPHLVTKRGWLNLRAGSDHILIVGRLLEDFACCYDWRKSKGLKTFDYQIKSAMESCCSLVSTLASSAKNLDITAHHNIGIWQNRRFKSCDCLCLFS
jgi:hypothetical protein